MGRTTPPTVKWGTAKTATSATGATFVNLSDFDCDDVTILNETGQALDVRSPNSADFVTIADGSGITVAVSASSLEVMVRRNDQSNTPVTVRFMWHKYQS